MRALAPLSRARCVLFGILLCASACLVLTWQATPAHALFTTNVQLSTTHAVEAFPTALSVDANGYKARQNAVDRGQLTVEATFSDGTTRVLDGSEYSLSEDIIPSGDKGLFPTEAIFTEGWHSVSAPFELNIDEAYGAQYGDTLVFGRGLPAETYGDKELTNTTWGIEGSGCVPRWNKGNLITVVDIDRVKPVSLINWFNNCPTMRTVVLDQMDTSRVTSFYFLFSENTGMVTCDVSKWDASHVTNTERMFSRCRLLKTLDLSAWRTPVLQDSRLMFYRAESLTSTGDLSHWDMSHVTVGANMFDLCNSLSYVGDISGWRTGNMTSMAYMFAGCYVLSVDCSKWDASKVTNYDDYRYFRRDAPGVKPPVSYW